MNYNYKFILFEGTDASGKISLAKTVSNIIGGVYYYSPPQCIRFIRTWADRSSPRIRYLYYLLGNYITSGQ